MDLYKTKLRIIVPVLVEAESLEEAERVIDGIIAHAGEVVVYEGTQDEHDDCLVGDKPEWIGRGDIELDTTEPALNEPTRADIKNVVAEVLLHGWPKE